MAGGYVYEDPDVPGVWFATRRAWADERAGDAGPFPSSSLARASLLGSLTDPPPTGAPRGGARPRVPAPRAWGAERAQEAAVRAPLPGELLDAARTAGDGAETLARAWPEAARLPLDQPARRQVIGRLTLLPALESLDRDRGDGEAAEIIATVAELLRRYAGEPHQAAGRSGVSGLRERLAAWRRVAHPGSGRRDAAREAPPGTARPEPPAGPGRRRSVGSGSPPGEGGALWEERRSWYQLEERHMALQIGRLCVIGIVAGAAIVWRAPPFPVDVPVALVGSAAAAAAHAALLGVPLRWTRRLRLAVDVSLVVDAAWVACLATASGSSASPLFALSLLLALLATLGYSARTGVKAAIVSSLAYLALVWRDEGRLVTESAAPRLLVLWAVVSVAAAGAAIGERELRTRAGRLGILQRAEAELLVLSDPDALEGVARAAAREILPGWEISTRRGEGPADVRMVRRPTSVLVTVPVTDRGTPVGVIECRRARRRARSPVILRARDVLFLGDLGSALGVALSRAELLETLARASATDPLTELANRRAFDGAMARELARTRRTGRPLSLCIVDVDHFKRFNDTHGHLAGDRALVQVAHVLRSTLRGTDLAARHGGEEFALLLTDSGRDAAVVVAERVRAAVCRIPTPGEPLTVSIGIATASEACFPDELVASADEALYAAKARGRNRVEVDRGSPDTA